MKFKTTCLAALTLFMSASLIVSCSTDNTDENPTSAKKTDNFLLKSKDEDSEFTLTEVYIGDESRPEGYLVTEIASKDVVSFLDIKNTDFKVTPFDPNTESIQKFGDMDGFTKYYSGDDFEFINVGNDPGFEPPHSGEPVTFRKRYSYGSPVNGPDGCTQGVYEASYVLGIRISKPKQTMITNEAGNLVQAQVPCGGTWPIE